MPGSRASADFDCGNGILLGKLENRTGRQG